MTNKDTELQAKLSEARSRLGAVLLECEGFHMHEWQGRPDCTCRGCRIRKHVERVLEALE